nr:hypothetical protein [Pseudonocardia alni]
MLISNVCTDPRARARARARARGHGRAAFDAVLAWSHTVDAGRAELLAATDDGRRMYEESGSSVSRTPVMRAPLHPRRGRLIR